MDDLKKCSVCSEMLPRESFQKKNSARDGLRSQCKTCRTVETKKRYGEFKAKLLEQSKAWAKTPEGRESHHAARTAYRSRNKEKISESGKSAYRKFALRRMLNSARAKAKKKGYVCDLTTDDVDFPVHCPVFGTALVIGDGCVTDNSPSLDRIDNSKGYVRGNVIIVSHRANAIKNNATAEELRLVYDFYKKLEEDRAALAVAVTVADRLAKGAV